MMPPRRETASEDVAIIGLQAGKGFRLSPTPEVRAPPQQRRPTTSSADVMEPQKVAGTTPKGGDQCSESKGGTHQQQHGDEGERRRLPRLYNNASSEGNNARKRRHCWPSTTLDRAFTRILGNEMMAARRNRQQTAVPADGGTTGRDPPGATRPSREEGSGQGQGKRAASPPILYDDMIRSHFFFFQKAL